MVVREPIFRSMGWPAAIVAGALLLQWVAIANGFPLLFADSGGYLRVGTELHYLPDRPIVYGLMIAPLARIAGTPPSPVPDHKIFLNVTLTVRP